MATEPGDDSRTIVFQDGRTARLIEAGPAGSAASVVRALDLAAPRPVLIVAGAADSLDPAVVHRLRTLVEHGALKAAVAAGAAIVDGGTATGIMALVGEAVRSAGSAVPLIGVAPGARVLVPDSADRDPNRTPLDSNHSHFVLTSGNAWGDETAMLFDLASVLSSGRRAMLLLAGGGDGALDEILQAVRADMPVLVLAGSGGIADVLAGLVTSGARSIATAAPGADRDGRVDEIIAHGNADFIAIDADPELLERLVARDLAEDETLRWAWQQYHAVTISAAGQQRQFHVLQGTTLALGVLATALVTVSAALSASVVRVPLPVSELLRVSTVLVPILLTTLLAVAARFRPGPRWILLRGTAESIKREIYRYRARAGAYGAAASRQRGRMRLATAVGGALSSLMRTEVNMAALADDAGDGLHGVDAAARHASKGDDGMSDLSAAGYVRFRLDDQTRYYRRRVREYERSVVRLRLAMVGMGALGTFLAAVGVPLAVAVTTAFVGAYANYLEALQLETTIVLYNQAATSLAGIRAWWTALPPERQVARATIDRLVERTERVVRSEQTGWVEEMQEAMTQLQHEDEADDSPGDRGSDDRPDAGRIEHRTRPSLAVELLPHTTTRRPPRPIGSVEKP